MGLFTLAVMLGGYGLKQVPLLPTDNTYNLAAVGATTPYTLFDGETVPLPATNCAYYMTQTAGVGLNNGLGLKFTPDGDHGGVIYVYCGGRSRQDFSGYQSLDFYIRSDSADPDPQTIYLITNAPTVAGAGSSNKIAINSYIEGGAINTSWRKVSIPTSVLKTANWDLNRTDAIYFATSNKKSVYYIDDVIFSVSGSNTSSVIPTPVSPVPTAQLSSYSTSINAGQTTTLTWTSTDATSCTATGGWSGAKTTSGSEAITPSITTTYSLSCTGAGGTSNTVSVTVSVVVVSPVVTTTSLSSYVLFDGETVPLPATNCAYYMTQTAGVGLNNGLGLKFTPDGDHGGVIYVYCGGRSRQDFSGYQSLDFYIRSDSADPDPQTIYLITNAPTVAGAGSSNKIAINSYIEGGAINTSWRKVSIPTSVLKTANWDLNRTDAIYFATSNKKSVYYIDNIIFNSGSNGQVVSAAPTLSFSASPTSINAGQTTTLTWTSTDATSCTATGGWSGAKTTSGSEAITPSITTTYSLSCTGAGGTSNTVSVTVSVASLLPTITSANLPNYTVVAGQVVSFNATDGGSGYYNITSVYRNGTPASIPTGVLFNPLTGAFSWAPTNSQSAVYRFVISVNQNGVNKVVEPWVYVAKTSRVCSTSYMPQVVCDAVNSLFSQGKAAGNTGDLYYNLDGKHSDLYAYEPDTGSYRYPFDQIVDTIYDYTWCHVPTTHQPAVGNASVGYPDTNWTQGCVMNYPGGVQMYQAYYTGNNLPVFPALSVDAPVLPYIFNFIKNNVVKKTNLMLGNVPYVTNTAKIEGTGPSMYYTASSGSDRWFVRAYLLASAAFKPEVKRALITSKMWAPTIQAITRRSMVGVDNDNDYMSYYAQGSTLMSQYSPNLNDVTYNIDYMGILNRSQALSVETIPPLVVLSIVSEDFGVTEQNFTTDQSISRYVATANQTRTIKVDASGTHDTTGSSANITYVWRVIRGDASKVTITPDANNPAIATLQFKNQVGPERIDVGVFAKKVGGDLYSMPGLITVYYPN